LIEGGVEAGPNAVLALAREGCKNFPMMHRSNALHVLNAPSPGAVASLAISSEMAAQIATTFGVN